MAMSATRMGDTIVDAIKAKNPEAFDAGEEDELREYWYTICQEIIDEIILGAVVEVNHDGPRTGSITS